MITQQHEPRQQKIDSQTTINNREENIMEVKQQNVQKLNQYEAKYEDDDSSMIQKSEQKLIMQPNEQQKNQQKQIIEDQINVPKILSDKVMGTPQNPKVQINPDQKKGNKIGKEQNKMSYLIKNNVISPELNLAFRMNQISKLRQIKYQQKRQNLKNQLFNEENESQNIFKKRNAGCIVKNISKQHRYQSLRYGDQVEADKLSQITQLTFEKRPNIGKIVKLMRQKQESQINNKQQKRKMIELPPIKDNKFHFSSFNKSIYNDEALNDLEGYQKQKKQKNNKTNKIKQLYILQKSQKISQIYNLRKFISDIIFQISSEAVKRIEQKRSFFRYKKSCVQTPRLLKQHNKNKSSFEQKWQSQGKDVSSISFSQFISPKHEGQLKICIFCRKSDQKLVIQKGNELSQKQKYLENAKRYQNIQKYQQELKNTLDEQISHDLHKNQKIDKVKDKIEQSQSSDSRSSQSNKQSQSQQQDDISSQQQQQESIHNASISSNSSSQNDIEKSQQV